MLMKDGAMVSIRLVCPVVVVRDSGVLTERHPDKSLRAQAHVKQHALQEKLVTLISATTPDQQFVK